MDALYPKALAPPYSRPYHCFKRAVKLAVMHSSAAFYQPLLIPMQLAGVTVNTASPRTCDSSKILLELCDYEGTTGGKPLSSCVLAAA